MHIVICDLILRMISFYREHQPPPLPAQRVKVPQLENRSCNPQSGNLRGSRRRLSRWTPKTTIKTLAKMRDLPVQWVWLNAPNLGVIILHDFISDY